MWAWCRIRISRGRVMSQVSDNIITGVFLVIDAASIWRGITRLEYT